MKLFSLPQLLIVFLCFSSILPLNGQDTILLTSDTNIIVTIEEVNYDYVKYSLFNAENEKTYLLPLEKIKEIKSYNKKNKFSVPNKEKSAPHSPIGSLFGIALGSPGGIGPGFGLTYAARKHMVKLQADFILEIDLGIQIGEGIRELPRENMLMTGLTYGYKIVDKPSFKVIPSIGIGHYLYNRRGDLKRNDVTCTSYIFFGVCEGDRQYERITESSIAIPVELMFGFYTSRNERTRLEFQIKGMLAKTEKFYSTGVYLHF